jgi:hypothetical protein
MVEASMFRLLIVTASGLLLAGTVRPLSAPGLAAAGAAERFTATAVTVAKAGLKPHAVNVEISIDRWSTDAERDRLIDTLKIKGSNRLLALIRSLPSIGLISTTTSKGTSLRFAHSKPTADGGRQIILATERPTSLTDQRTRVFRTADHPFSLVDIRIDSNGNGEGKLAYAAQLTLNRKTGAIEIEDYATEPVRLTNVRSAGTQ